MATKKTLLLCFTVLFTITNPTVLQAQLCPDFYDQICPQALPTIKAVVGKAIEREPRMGASLLRLHFHDGCDGSVLLDDTATFTGEKTAGPNNNSARGFEVIDEIKKAVNQACHGNVVSCADVLAVAARDSVATLGGPAYPVLLGRKDSRTASRDAANANIPSPISSDISTLVSRFQSRNLTLQDLVVLSGAHTIGFAQCALFRNRTYNESNIDPYFAGTLRSLCPTTGGDQNLGPFDGSPTRFDTGYFKGLLQQKGLLHTDQVLFKGDGSVSDGLVRYYSENLEAFWVDFGVSMIKMGNLRPPEGSEVEVRMDCRRVN
ncbi:Cationic peroxidase 1 [Acorus gramineus]|uniref:Peroxidase n=1 Tax=Acorus gramineus TaxID=55184 RepID=A0AAV9B861_ACOGR|nr:Cationic peroxidase 1 [Acorus gramineus]